MDSETRARYEACLARGVAGIREARQKADEFGEVGAEDDLFKLEVEVERLLKESLKKGGKLRTRVRHP